MADYDDLEIDEDLRFQRGDWRRERVGWVVMGLLVVAGLLGAFGHGILSYRTASADGFEVGYEVVARRGGVTGVHVKVDREAIVGDDIGIHLPTSFLRHVLVESIVPEPDSAELEGDGVTYRFALGDEPPAERAVIRFDVRPDTIGRLDADIGLVGHATVTIHQFLLP